MDPNSKKAPTLDLHHLVAAAQYCQKILEGYTRPAWSNELVPPPGGPAKLNAHQGTIYGNRQPDLLEIEAIVANLVQQGLLHGFVSHKQSRFAILGAKIRGGALNAGFPPPFGVIKTRAEKDGEVEVPGWVRQERKAQMGGVVNLSGIARPVGTGE